MLKNVLIVVDDIEKSIEFYRDLFGLQVILKNEGNVILSEGLVLQDADVWGKTLNENSTPFNNMMELYFEDFDIDGLLAKYESGKYSVRYAVDYKLISICHRGDIVVSQDYGVAAMALGKGAYAIHQSGKWYTNENIDQMLMERHLNKKARRASGKKHLRGSRKRTAEDDEHFRESFEKMIHMAMDKEK